MSNPTPSRRPACPGAVPGPRRTSRPALGCSLVEALCCLAITLVLVSGAWPMLGDLMARQTLLAQAAGLETDLVLARTMAQVQKESMRLSVHQAPEGNSCYVIYSGPIGACRCDGQGQSTCSADAQVLRVVATSRSAGIALASINRPLTFDAMMGTVSPTATLRLADRDGRTVHQVINLTGRVRSCTPDLAWGGLRRC